MAEIGAIAANGGRQLSARAPSATTTREGRRPALHARATLRRDGFQVIRNFGNQHDVRADGEARLQREPSRLVARHLDHREASDVARGRAHAVQHLCRVTSALLEPKDSAVAATSFSTDFGMQTMRSPFGSSL